MDSMASQITSLAIAYSTVYSDIDHRKHQSSTSLDFLRGIHRWPVNSLHKWPVTQKMFPIDDVIMNIIKLHTQNLTQWTSSHKQRRLMIYCCKNVFPEFLNKNLMGNFSPQIQPTLIWPKFHQPNAPATHYRVRASTRNLSTSTSMSTSLSMSTSTVKMCEYEYEHFSLSKSTSTSYPK